MPDLGEFLKSGGEVGRQLFVWGFLQGVITQGAAPFLRDLEYVVNDKDPNVVAVPTDLADWVERGIVTMDYAVKQARKSGVDTDQFHRMRHAAGEPPALQEALTWWRRGIITFEGVGPTKTTVANAIATGRIYTYWTDVIKKAQFTPPSVADAVTAVLRGQIPRKEGVALAYYAGLGVKTLGEGLPGPSTETERAFKILTDTAGNPPSLSELLTLVRRKLIPMGDITPKTKKATPTEISFSQGIYEGNNKDKWLPKYADLVKYVPPPRTVTAVYRHGGYNATEAQAHFEANGMTATDARAYIKSVEGTKIAGTKLEAQGVVTALYYDQAITKAQATTMLGHLGYATDTAAFILDVEDLKREKASVDSAVSRIRTLFVDHHITVTEATTALSRVNIPAAQITQLITTWTSEAAANVKTLSAAEIADLLYYKVESQATAMTLLEKLGYGPLDAWRRLSVRMHAPLPTKPTTNVNPFYRFPTAKPGG